MEGTFQLGDVLMLDDSHCVVVGLSGQSITNEEVPEEHIAVWFGELDVEQLRMQVRTVPEEYFKKGPAPSVVH